MRRARPNPQFLRTSQGSLKTRKSYFKTSLPNINPSWQLPSLYGPQQEGLLLITKLNHSKKTKISPKKLKKSKPRTFTSNFIRSKKPRSKKPKLEKTLKVKILKNPILKPNLRKFNLKRPKRTKKPNKRQLSEKNYKIVHKVWKEEGY